MITPIVQTPISSILEVMGVLTNLVEVMGVLTNLLYLLTYPRIQVRIPGFDRHDFLRSLPGKTSPVAQLAVLVG